MKKTLLALSLIGCLVLGMTSCVEIISGDNSQTSQITVQENNKGTNPSTNENAPANTDSNGSANTTTDANGGLQQGGANTEGGFGPIHRP